MFRVLFRLLGFYFLPCYMEAQCIWRDRCWHILQLDCLSSDALTNAIRHDSGAEKRERGVVESEDAKGEAGRYFKVWVAGNCPKSKFQKKLNNMPPRRRPQLCKQSIISRLASLSTLVSLWPSSPLFLPASQAIPKMILEDILEARKVWKRIGTLIDAVLSIRWVRNSPNGYSISTSVNSYRNLSKFLKFHTYFCQKRGRSIPFDRFDWLKCKNSKSVGFPQPQST
jgi:hypothetical protein